MTSEVALCNWSAFCWNSSDRPATGGGNRLQLTSQASSASVAQAGLFQGPPLHTFTHSQIIALIRMLLDQALNSRDICPHDLKKYSLRKVKMHHMGQEWEVTHLRRSV